VNQQSKNEQLTQNLALHAMHIFSFDWNLNTPVQVASKWCGHESALQSTVNNLALSIDDRIWRPFSSFGGSLDPLFCLWLNLAQLQVHVWGNPPGNSVSLSRQTSGLDQVDCVQGFAAAVALITASIFVAAIGANSFNKAVGQEPGMMFS